MLEHIKGMTVTTRTASSAQRRASATSRRNAIKSTLAASAIWVAVIAPVAAHAAADAEPAQGQQPQIAHTSMDYGIGQPVNAAALARWNIDVSPDGRGLPKGSGDVATGRQVFETKCAACHGVKGEGGLGDRLVGGLGSLTSAHPVKTVGSYWPYATTLFDYIRRAMPFNAPQSLSANEVYAVSAFLLNANGIVPDGTRLDAKTLPKVKMPNRDGFVVDQR
ncbi:MAG TPA: cytochrome c [Trinickia sp.]|uniref:c-type cytochrome n=1 Tax=Trinickia sp. TaxID=2571163 RepID=UPI002BF08485|nr:cytochrome c [Trinickia sp.]HTI17183.1 cytochrome c [Trinickia sp.]